MSILNTRFYLVLSLLLAAGAQAQDYHPHHLLIKMKNGQRLNSSPYIKESQELIKDLYLVKTDHLEILENTAKTWQVEYVEKDYYHQKEALPDIEFTDNYVLDHSPSYRSFTGSFNDEYINRLWAFDSKWGMSVTEAYDQLPPWYPAEVIVAVVDTGVDYNHPDLVNVMWKNLREIPGDGIDNDGNGYVDDVYGINTVSRHRLSRRASTDPMGSHWHGTHVAGTIAADQNNGIGIAGVANNVKIMAIRAVPDNSNETDSDIIESFIYAAKHGAKIINCSFGKSEARSFAVRDTINAIGKDFGVLVIAASGNNSMGPFRWYDIDERPQYPASFDSENLLTVASTTKRGDLSSFSNIGKISVDLAAPGSDIFSTVKGNRYQTSDGTSMATPNVSGVAAMVLGYFPELTPVEIKNILMSSVKRQKSFEGMMRSPGVVNLKGALKAAEEYREKRWR